MLKVTEAASRKLGEIIQQQSGKGAEEIYGLRVSVQDGGCSCHPFALSLAPAAVVGDWIGNFEGVRVLVDPETAPQIEGVEIDYVETLEGSGFTVSRPNAHRACGCGGHHHDHGSHAHDESDAPAGHGGEEA